MFSKFLNLDQEKQDRIINAAIKEFAQKGYDKASTNEIVKEAGISKGLLFHYFQNKKQLYLFLFEYSYELIADEFYKKVDIADTDFFSRMRQAIMIKMDLLTQYPDLFNFMQEGLMEDSAEIKVEMEKKKKELIDINFGKVYEGIDLSKFRDDVDIQKILKIITWTFEKMSDEELYKAKMQPDHKIDYKKVSREAEEYFEVLIKCFYK
ncbi:TetR/AcrR family transcriptional regulator [Neobacillus rhizophilus]|uniref:TetR/AcrR family transcriptional regulator n=1 Tax=Neobacillus rhizophilus TaxID=2833579 RepID=A0A942U7S8_9BACI|nr:TetR/AcrR family transcriptional regulator [Neobacillus rhizophilus]MBS4212484.1 TetR/AcrR family transcriptional regulator [Neobacillus rhizophilus]MBU8914890.1 TetR/AcrR family transcriptional regulator [Bacillus sp. FJAT-29953]